MSVSSRHLLMGSSQRSPYWVREQANINFTGAATDSLQNIYAVTSAGSLFKYDRIGRLMWAIQSDQNEAHVGVQVNSADEVLVFGKNSSSNKAYIIKFADTGTRVKSVEFYGPSSAPDMFVQGMTIDDSDNIYIVYYDLQTTIGVITKFDDQLTALWDRGLRKSGQVVTLECVTAYGSSVYFGGHVGPSDASETFGLYGKIAASNGAVQYNYRIRLNGSTGDQIYLNAISYDSNRDQLALSGHSGNNSPDRVGFSFQAVPTGSLGDYAMDTLKRYTWKNKTGSAFPAATYIRWNDAGASQPQDSTFEAYFTDFNNNELFRVVSSVSGPDEITLADVWTGYRPSLNDSQYIDFDISNNSFVIGGRDKLLSLATSSADFDLYSNYIAFGGYTFEGDVDRTATGDYEFTDAANYTQVAGGLSITTAVTITYVTYTGTDSAITDATGFKPFPVTISAL